MSADQTRREINKLDNELTALEKKLADEIKKEADKTKRVNDTKKSITKNTSLSMVQSKTRQIQGYQDDLVKISNARADINKKIADKRKNRADKALKLQKEEADEVKKSAKTQKTIYENYEKRISDLTTQLTRKAIEIRSSQHIYSPTTDEEYDVFLSHATEDKVSFADELCQELQNAGIKVWYDVLSMTWGDSLRSKIDNGLKKSKYGIVVISKDYIHKGWTNYELDGLFQREMTGGKTILPIWHNITKKEVQDFSPTLSGRLALSTAIMTPIEIAAELKKILELGKSDEEAPDNA